MMEERVPEDPGNRIPNSEARREDIRFLQELLQMLASSTSSVHLFAKTSKAGYPPLRDQSAGRCKFR